jgi:tryptophanyl-tRNA synthetase
MSRIILTGIKPTGMPHLGNYIGAIQPALELTKDSSVTSYLFVADYHSLTTVHDAQALSRMIHQVSAAWLACGLDPKKTIMYRQSDIPELFELNWILSCMTPKGLMNRGHSYKALIQANRMAGRRNTESGVNMGIYNYPILMSADILLFSADEVPVSEDQEQHLEITRDIAIKFNHTFNTDILKPPKTLVKTKLLPGLDGEKMSKSKGNHIPLFCSSGELRKIIMKIKTDSSNPNEPKDPESSILFSMYKAFASEEQVKAMADKYRKGIGWGEVKEHLYLLLEENLSEKRKVYESLMDNPGAINALLKEGAKKAREKAKFLINKIRETTGIDSL